MSALHAAPTPRVSERIDRATFALLAALGIVTILGAIGSTAAGSPGFVTVALAVTAVAALTLWTLGGLAVASGVNGTPPHPHRAIDASSPLSQSDPDAPGHPLPRAPQRRVSAA